MNATSMKEMVKQWEQRNGQKVTSAMEVKLNGMSPPVEKMDPIISTFINCEKLSLSTNVIERIANLSGLKKLKILSLGRNNIKSLSGIEAAGETLEELWLSYNLIEKLKGIGSLKKLRLLTLANNLIRDWSEISRLIELQNLKEIVLVGNPIEERHSAEGNWRSEMVRRLPNLAKLDGWHVTTENELQPEDSTISHNEEAEVPTSDQIPPEVSKEPNLLEDDGKTSQNNESTNEEESSPRKGSTTL